jgi:urease accessory protein
VDIITAMGMKADSAPLPWLLRLLQLVSPGLPIGAYSYSQALERAVEQGTVHDRDSAQQWLRDQLELNLARNDAALFCRLFDAWRAQDDARLARWNNYLLATREGHELRAETLNMGNALLRVLRDARLLEDSALAALARIDQPTYTAAFAGAMQSAGVDVASALRAYLWTWLEGQVLAAVKLVPLGQTAGQLILRDLIPVIDAVTATAQGLADAELSNFAPAFAIASAQHEVQYSRLFRS